MRKELITPNDQAEKSSRWLDLENLAKVELSSEDPRHPIEAALTPGTGDGWLASQLGPQTIRIVFDTPQFVRQIYLEFREEKASRTQEFLLRWSPDPGQSYREIVRQQYNFNPPGTTTEREEYQVNLTGVSVIELQLVPDLGGAEVLASLARLLIA
ncbi:hypothetical protein GMST_08570 [Geomonas silvestris]|uniref:Carbohydrate-binding protein n=1 Tax=Geomonas silvestris TaxID=2740184 RepID=A0A6V8MF28_9BACT|nr:hypothetical protein [Geomonas silvestris]GFO58532.1 hypothetical protein GMST_08570 [Geomonas silvestris]